MGPHARAIQIFYSVEINAIKIKNMVVSLQTCEITYVCGIPDKSLSEICYFQIYFCFTIHFKIRFFYTAATGDMPAYQIRTPTTTLPQGVVMAASPGTLHSPQQMAEEATRKRELRLLKNR